MGSISKTEKDTSQYPFLFLIPIFPTFIIIIVFPKLIYFASNISAYWNN